MIELECSISDSSTGAILTSYVGIFNHYFHLSLRFISTIIPALVSRKNSDIVFHISEPTKFRKFFQSFLLRKDISNSQKFPAPMIDDHHMETPTSTSSIKVERLQSNLKSLVQICVWHLFKWYEFSNQEMICFCRCFVVKGFVADILKDAIVKRGILCKAKYLLLFYLEV